MLGRPRRHCWPQLSAHPFRDTDLDCLQSSAIDRYVIHRRKKGVADRTINGELIVFRAILNHAVETWDLDSKPFKVRLLKITRTLPKALTPDQVQTLLSHAGLRAARRAEFPNLPWARCQFHLQQNAVGYVPRVSMRTEVAQDLRAVFTARDRGEANERLSKTIAKYHATAPALAAWMETAVPEGLTVFLVPEAQRRRLRTTNALERVNREIKRRTRVATLFPNEASLLRLVSALGAEISEEWETGRLYLAPEPPRDKAPEGDARGCVENHDRPEVRPTGTPTKNIRHRTA